MVALATTVMVAIAFLVPLGLLIRNFARDQALNAAEREAQALAPVLAVVADPGAIEVALGTTESGAEGRLTVFLPEGTVLGAEAPVDASVELARRGRAFSEAAPGGVAVFDPVALPQRGVAVVRVFVPDADLDEGVARSWGILGVLAVVLVALAVVVADRVARSATQPITTLSSAAAKVGAGELDVHVEPDGPPEVASLSRVFNQMVGQIKGLLVAEREMAADLSHRLRTPLTALRLDAEGLADGAEASRIVGDVDALEHAVTAVIEETRRAERRVAGARCDLGVVAAERVGFWAALAEDQGRAYELDLAPGPHVVALSAAELESALDVVLANVFHHTPEGTAFAVRLVVDDGGVRVLSVEDDGPGLAPGALQRGVSTAGSTGLGLDIARRATEAAGGRLRAENRPDGGARVVLEFPPLP